MKLILISLISFCHVQYVMKHNTFIYSNNNGNLNEIGKGTDFLYAADCQQDDKTSPYTSCNMFREIRISVY